MFHTLLVQYNPDGSLFIKPIPKHAISYGASAISSMLKLI